MVCLVLILLYEDIKTDPKYKAQFNLQFISALFANLLSINLDLLITCNDKSLPKYLYSNKSSDMVTM